MFERRVKLCTQSDNDKKNQIQSIISGAIYFEVLVLRMYMMECGGGNEDNIYMYPLSPVSGGRSFFDVKKKSQREKSTGSNMYYISYILRST